MTLRLWLVLGCLHLAACGSSPPGEAAVAARSVIYGDDDRREVFELEEPRLRRLALEQAVAIIPAAAIDASDPDDVRVTTETLRARAELCADVPFAEQPSAARCSGVLVDADVVLTAAHCVRDEAECASSRFVFGYAYREPGRLRRLTRDDLFECSRVLYRDERDEGFDVALVQLDRPVMGRQPALLAAVDPVAVGRAVTVVSFPAGLPVKIDTGARVIADAATDEDYFSVTADAFQGSSGGGVYEDDVLVGLLLRGQADFRREGDCHRPVVLDVDSERGHEQALHIARVVDALCGTPVGNCPSEQELTGCTCTTRGYADAHVAVLVLGIALLAVRNRRRCIPRDRRAAL